jgi:hypothetical protein
MVASASSGWAGVTEDGIMQVLLLVVPPVGSPTYMEAYCTCMGAVAVD